MQEQLKIRLHELEAEYQRGQEQLATLEQESNGLREMLLRIGGAIQVMREELNKSTPREEE